jgi:hypothetical protein
LVPAVPVRELVTMVPDVSMVRSFESPQDGSKFIFERIKTKG